MEVEGKGKENLVEVGKGKDNNRTNMSLSPHMASYFILHTLPPFWPLEH